MDRWPRHGLPALLSGAALLLLGLASGRAAQNEESNVAAELPVLIRRHRPGHALAREFYTDPAIFECDMQRMLLKHWFCAGHVSSIARTASI